jgi:CRISPR system Cascade subunit CasA
MQVAALKDAVETRDTATMRPWPQLTLDFVSGNAPVLFDHCVDKHPTGVSSSIALRHLLGYLQFAPGGTVQRFRFRDESGPLDNVAAVLPVGKSLHQTLCLSLHAWSRNSENDLPAWEMDQLRAEQLRVVGATLPSGEVDLFTRLTRSVLLAPVVEGEDGRIVVKRIRFGAGLTLNTHDASFPDPMAAYRKRADNRISPVTFKDGRAFWRDLPAILPSGKGTYHHPAVLDRALICSQSTGSDENINFFVMGTASDPVKCKVFRWRTESLELPKVLLADPDASYSMRLEVSFAEELYARLQGVLASLIAESMPKQKDAKALSRTILANGPAASTFFSAAERALPKLMQQIAAGNFDAAGMDWKTVLADAAKQTWTATRRSLGDSPAVLRADARTWPRFTGLLNTLVPPTQKLETTPEEVTP